MRARNPIADSAEEQRLKESRDRNRHWKRWGPYLSERQWGTVREDYSEHGTAWDYLPHDHARSRAYRWGEDGLGGISDRHQKICFALALWNGKDPILKERLLGLTGNKGNHGEDVKEYYYYLDSAPTHSYMKFLYKYPQAAFPYAELVDENRRREKDQPEFELIDTGVFNENRYFDVVVEYAKAGPEDILIRVTAHNRGPEPTELRLLPTVWFRNIWSWDPNASRPILSREPPSGDTAVIRVDESTYGRRWLICDGAPELLFTENETNNRPLFDVPNRTPYVKDGINNYIVAGETGAINPDQAGTKASALYHANIEPGESTTLTLEQQRAVVDTCARHLLTSHGLRSLTPDDPQYRGQYGGAPIDRDGSYHQGTVWAWLLGSFALAHLRVYHDPNRAAQFLDPMANRLNVHGLGSISDIFDGDAPFQPRGCIAQAWSVAEILRAWTQIAAARTEAKLGRAMARNA